MRKLRKDRRPATERFWEKVDKTDFCWMWTAAKTKCGYGNFKEIASGTQKKWVRAHRFAYEERVGPIPEGLVIDHLCHEPACVNPDHLRAVTHTENMHNLRGPGKANTSGFSGVSYNKAKRKYRAYLRREGKQIHLGFFDDPAEASKAVERKRREISPIPSIGNVTEQEALS